MCCDKWFIVILSCPEKGVEPKDDETVTVYATDIMTLPQEWALCRCKHFGWACVNSFLVIPTLCYTLFPELSSGEIITLSTVEPHASSIVDNVSASFTDLNNYCRYIRPQLAVITRWDDRRAPACFVYVLLLFPSLADRVVVFTDQRFTTDHNVKKTSLDVRVLKRWAAGWGLTSSEATELSEIGLTERPSMHVDAGQFSGFACMNTMGLLLKLLVKITGGWKNGCLA